MKIILKNLAYAAIAAGLSISVFGTQASEIKVGTGSEMGSYFGMTKDIERYCSSELTKDTLTVMTSGGAVDNLLGLGKKKYSMGDVQEDVLNFHAKRSPRKINQKRIKVITPMHVEAMHLLIPKGYKPAGKNLSFFESLSEKISGGGDQPVKIDIGLLKDQKVGAWGGSIVSGQALSFFFDLNVDVVEINQGDTGNMPIIIVAGYPSKVVEAYLATGKYILVSIDHAKVAQRADFYTNETVNYSVNGRMVNVPTIGVRALLVGKSFRKKSRNLGASELATCITNNLADMADDPDTSPNWSSVFEYVDDEGQVGWDYFPLIEDKLWGEE
jgi:hypothetical protein